MEDIRLYKVGENQILKFRESGFFKLVWLEKGTINLSLDLKDYTVSESGLLMILPDTQMELETGPGTKVVVISFAISIIKIDGRDFAVEVFRMFVSYIGGLQAEISKNTLHKIRQIITSLFEEYESETPSYDIVWSYLKIILLNLIREAGNRVSVPDKNIERFHIFFTLLNEHAKKEKNVTFYASKLNISTKRLNQILQSLTNKSASYFIQEHLIMEAKRELIKCELSVNEIAYALGFEDRAYFSRFFKRWTEVSPNKYKKIYFQKRDEKLFKEGMLNYKAD